ncbi:MAG: Gfo/Idh/MocA family oxidoreductase [Acidimicrobiales bacterium]|jgi:predicted dehydrogenase|nr:Gfo/Idh/MocA family oxidoreductase [Acidimicrobiales bacterium]
MTGDTELRYGVIGTGMMGVEHINNLLHVEGAAISAVSDPDEGSRGTASALVPDAATFADHRDLIDAGVCDAVVIASPNMTHVDVLGDVLQTELHVLVEKPLCTTVEDCYTVMDLAAAREAITWVGLEYRYIPPIAKLIEDVDDGAVGRPRMVAIREHRMPFLEKVGNWNRFSANTGGTLVEKCCHFFDLMNRIMPAPPVRVMASGNQDVNHLDEVYDGETSDILDNAYVIVDFADGSRGMLDLCMFAEATRYTEEVSVLGAKGKVEALLPGNEFRTGRRGEHFYGTVPVEEIHDDRIAYQGFHDGSSYIEHTHFRDAILEGRAPDVSLEDGLVSVAVGAAAHRSIDEGRPVEIAEFLR